MFIGLLPWIKTRAWLLAGCAALAVGLYGVGRYHGYQSASSKVATAQIKLYEKELELRDAQAKADSALAAKTERRLSETANNLAGIVESIDESVKANPDAVCSPTDDQLRNLNAIAEESTKR